MADHHRKIELQSAEDLQYLISNILRAATAKINTDLPPLPPSSLPDAEPDPFRARVEILVHQYLETVFFTTGENVTVAGLAPTEKMIREMLEGKVVERIEEEYEAFDPRLWEKAKVLKGQEEDLVEEIARLRREVPRKRVEGARGVFKEGVQEDERELGKREGNVDKGGDLGLMELERQKEVEESWRKGVEGLGKLKRTMPEMIARSEKAGRAETYVKESEGR